MPNNMTFGSIYRTVFLAVLFLFISYNFALNFARAGNYYLNLQDYLSERAALPFQFRILMVPVFKLLLNLLNQLSPQIYFSSLPLYLTKPEQLVYVVINCIGFFFALIFFHQLARTTFKSSNFVFEADLLFITATYSIFVLNPNLNFILPYDLPSLAFMQLCTLLVLRESRLLLALAFVFATVNRETSFVVVIFLTSRILLGLEPRRMHALLTVVALTVIWIVIKVSLSFFVTGSGPFILFDLVPRANLTILLKPWQWPNLLPLLLPFAVATYVLLRAPNRNALSWTGTYMLGFLALFMVAGITEHRSYGDLIGFSVISILFFLEHRGLIIRITDRLSGDFASTPL
jgi:hypothetical protein